MERQIPMYLLTLWFNTKHLLNLCWEVVWYTYFVWKGDSSRINIRDQRGFFWPSKHILQIREKVGLFSKCRQVYGTSVHTVIYDSDIFMTMNSTHLTVGGSNVAKIHKTTYSCFKNTTLKNATLQLAF